MKKIDDCGMENVCPNKQKLTLFFLLHFFFGSLGLASIVFVGSHYLVPKDFIQSTFFLFKYSSWAQLSLEPTKPYELMKYGFPTLCLIINMMISGLLYHHSLNLTEKTTNRLMSIPYLSLLAITNVVLVLISRALPGLLLFAGFYVWLIIYLAPFLNPIYASFKRIEIFFKNKTFIFFIATACLLQWLYIFSPYFQGRQLKIANDYMDIPEQTLIQGKYVDNTSFINTYKMGGLLKYDPRTKHVIQQILPNRAIKTEYPVTDDMLDALNENNEGRNYLFYSDSNRALYVKGPLIKDQVNMLWYLAADNYERTKLKLLSENINVEASKYQYTNAEREFVEKNAYEMKNHVLAGFYFHHQNAMYGPINEYLLGKSPEHITFLYGYLNSVVIGKLTQWLGHGTFMFENFTKVLYSFYPVYMLLLIIAAMIIFRERWQVLFVGLSCLLFLQLINFRAFMLAPGFNPLRHFFDVFVVVFFYLYVTSKRFRPIFLLLSFIFAILSVFNSMEFGATIFLSLLGALLIHHLTTQSSIKKMAVSLLYAVISIAIILVLHTYFKTANYSLMKYSILGVSTPHTSGKIIAVAILMIIFSCTFLIYCGLSRGSWTAFIALLLFYLQGTFIYFVWNPGLEHLLAIMFLLPFVLLAMARQIVLILPQMDCAIKPLFLLSMVGLLLSCILSGMVFDSKQAAYNKIFQNHKTYEWNFTKAHFITPMDPQPFDNAIHLIQKYSGDNKIYLISKYDNILPFLANKYSGMPFIQLDLSLVTNREVELATNEIMTNHPTYLFVDTDIERNHLGDVYDPLEPLTEYLDTFDASQGRAKVLDKMTKVFKKVKQYYVPLETGELITVYRRKTATLGK